MNSKHIALIIFILCTETAKSADALRNTNIAKAIQGTISGLAAGESLDRSYTRGLRQIRYTFDKDMIRGCTFIGKIFLTDEQFINLPKKNCEEMIHRMSYDKVYTVKNILFFEYTPLVCTQRNFTGQLYRCD